MRTAIWRDAKQTEHSALSDDPCSHHLPIRGRWMRSSDSVSVIVTQSSAAWHIVWHPVGWHVRPLVYQPPSVRPPLWIESMQFLIPSFPSVYSIGIFLAIASIPSIIWSFPMHVWGSLFMEPPIHWLRFLSICTLSVCMDVSWYASLCRSFVNVYLVFLCVYYVWIAVNSKRICDKAHGLLCLPDCLPVFLYACLYLALAFYHFRLNHQSVYLYVCISLSFSLSPRLPVSLSLYVAISLPLSLSLCLSVSFLLNCLRLSQSVYLYPVLISQSIYLSLSLSQYVSLSVYLSDSPSVSFHSISHQLIWIHYARKLIPITGE